MYNENGRLTITLPNPTQRREVLVQLSNRTFTFFPEIECNHLRRATGIATYIGDLLWCVEVPQEDGTFAKFQGGFALETGGVEIITVGIDAL